MELSIIQRVAQLIATQKLEGGKGAGRMTPPDIPPDIPQDKVEVKVSIPNDVRVVAEAVGALPERDPEREARVQKIRADVQAGRYRMTAEMVDQVAQKIASMLA